MTSFGNLLAPPTRLPVDPATELLADGADATAVAAAHPTSCAAWAALAETALAADRPVEAYAYARTGYHRGLDALRRAGWKGQGAGIRFTGLSVANNILLPRFRLIAIAWLLCYCCQ